MTRSQAPVDPVVAARRRRARRTALLAGGIALAVYVGFMLLTAMGTR